MDAVRCTQLTVGIVGIAGVAAYLLHVHNGQPLVHLDAVRQSRPFIGGVEGQLLDEGQPIHQDAVVLDTKLNTLRFLASDDRTYGLFTLTILFGMLSRTSPLRKCLCCWRYAVVMTAIVRSSLSVKRLDSACFHSISLISFSILSH